MLDEEQGENNHPELWLRFTEYLCQSRDLSTAPKLDKTKELVDGFFALTKTNYPTGLGALYAYERQTPEIAKSKIEGLKRHYNIHNARALEFFAVHEVADKWHTEELVNLIEKLTPEEQKQTAAGAIAGAKLLWHFLDGIHAN